MSVRELRSPKHRCAFGYPRGGEIVQCDCGRLWLGKTYPNRAFDKWVPMSRIGARLRGVRPDRAQSTEETP